MDEKSKQIDRQTLYEQVWSEPVTVVANSYGLSDVGLAKICRKLCIPLPSRGYWAKVKAGKIMGRAPLPKLDKTHHGIVTLTKLNSAALEAHTAAKKQAIITRAQTPAIVVPSELSSPHPLIRDAAKRLKQREGWSDEKGLRSAPAEVLHLEVTRSALDRSLLIMDTRGEHDLAVAGFHLEVFRRGDGGGDDLGQGELIFRGHFGKHDKSPVW